MRHFGDAGSVKRVAAAVGDGAHVIAELHDYLGSSPAPTNAAAVISESIGIAPYL